MENVSLFCYNQIRNPNKKGCVIMKKVLLGCLGTVLVLLALLIGFLAYFGPDYGIFSFSTKSAGLCSLGCKKA